MYNFSIDSQSDDYLHEPTGLDGNWDIVSAAASPINGEAGGCGGGGRRLPFRSVPAQLGLFAGRLQDLEGRQKGERVQRARGAEEQRRGLRGWMDGQGTVFIR